MVVSIKNFLRYRNCIPRRLAGAGAFALLLILGACASPTPPSGLQAPLPLAAPPGGLNLEQAQAGGLDTAIPKTPLGHLSLQDRRARTVDLTAVPNDVWQRVRRGYAIPNINNALVEQWQAYYATRPEFIRRVSERASRYLYHIVDETEKRGLPTELALLPIVESAYDPRALSPARAMGLWQFIPSTGRTYNLKQDWWRDERRDIVASTSAALDYLSALYEMHGDWHLALASYNWGEGSVKRAIEKNRAQGLPTDYLSLSMPEETRNYVPKLQAIKNLIANPEAFGLVLPSIDNQPYFVTINKNIDIDLRTAAKLAEMPLEEFKSLNPQFQRPMIQGAARPNILLPADKADIFQANLERHRGSLSSWRVHSVKGRERLSAIAKRYGLSTKQLAEANHLSTRSKVVSGQILMVPVRGSGVTPADADNNTHTDADAPRLRRASYEPVNGEAINAGNASRATPAPGQEAESSQRKSAVKSSKRHKVSKSGASTRSKSKGQASSRSEAQTSARKTAPRKSSNKSSSKSRKKNSSSQSHTEVYRAPRVGLETPSAVADLAETLAPARVVFGAGRAPIEVHALRISDEQRRQSAPIF